MNKFVSNIKPDIRVYLCTKLDERGGEEKKPAVVTYGHLSEMAATSSSFVDFEKKEIDLRLCPKQLMLHESCFLTEDELVALCRTRKLKLAMVS